MSSRAGSGAPSPVVLLHGATASARIWAPVLPALHAHRPVFVPTLAGHWGGPPLSVPPAMVVSGIVDAACQQLDEAGIESAHLVGNSLGGWVALELGRRGRALSVLALSPAGAWRSPKDLERMLRIFRVGAGLRRATTIHKLASRRRARRILLRAMAEHADRMSPAQVAALFEDMAGCAVLTDLLAGARDAGPMAAFEQLMCPVRIAWGDRDRTLPFMRYGAPMLAAVPGAELVMLPGVGHVPMIDDPALTARTILDFIASVDIRGEMDLKNEA
ncbi:alpha/beta fold hydrolase [Mycobacterium sp.]|uniref:alpha/beta fold hydrolase n=1 Tax=Mycobacterium sp. TaxID=1785 RepID=UPI0025F65256|nr:alpha/beta fold hydrolase [Mycobacterium sp.]